MSNLGLIIFITIVRSGFFFLFDPDRLYNIPII